MQFSGCKTVLVIDGNMKNRRDVCAASEAGFIEFEGLPGAIKTGCPLSPGYQSKYCYEHAPRISPRTAGEDQTHDCGEGIVRLITAKKQTCSETYYQVHGTHDHTCLQYCILVDRTVNTYVTVYFVSGSLAWTRGADDLGACINSTTSTN